LDGGMSGTAAEQFRQLCTSRLHSAADNLSSVGIMPRSIPSLIEDDNYIAVPPFSIAKRCDESMDQSERSDGYILTCDTTAANIQKILRALQIPGKPVLLEGSPGIGKTSLVEALAARIRQPVTRINLSDQTDIGELFGSDLPMEGGAVGQFAWRNGPFLNALQQGDWILLDELNLASQSVLEGLNAVFDHRGERLAGIIWLFSLLRIRILCFFTPLDPGSGSEMNFFRIPDPAPFW
jgi:midasin